MPFISSPYGPGSVSAISGYDDAEMQIVRLNLSVASPSDNTH